MSYQLYFKETTWVRLSVLLANHISFFDSKLSKLKVKDRASGNSPHGANFSINVPTRWENAGRRGKSDWLVALRSCGVRRTQAGPFIGRPAQPCSPLALCELQRFRSIVSAPSVLRAGQTDGHEGTNSFCLRNRWKQLQFIKSWRH